MEWTTILFVTVLLAKNVSGQDIRNFPKDFIFGAATAAYQVEGGWNDDGKTVNIWDHLLHNNACYTKDCKNGDIAADSYHKMDRDVEMLRELGVNHYRFSISWTRILPKGVASEVNFAGVGHYNDFINKLLKYNIEPVVTIYHWDLPQVLQDMGGWTNPAIIDWFGDYARVLFEVFGNKVKKWITINEPFQICYLGYEAGSLAPALNLTGIGVYMCNQNLLLAHAKAWHIYNDEYRETQKGKIGITVATEYFDPLTPKDSEVSELFSDFFWGTYTYPIFSAKGGYPPKFEERIAAKSSSQGLSRSRLPKFTPEQIDYIKGTSDFYGMNHYSSYLAYSNSSVIGANSVPSWGDDVGATITEPPEKSQFEGEMIKMVPWGFYKILTKIKKIYNNPPILITENGYAYKTKGLNDEYRILFMHSYLNALLDAIDEGSNIIGYTVWSLMDNFEWQQGYTQRFGLYEVDFDSPARTRTARESAKYYKEILRTRQLPKVLTRPQPEFPSAGYTASPGTPTKENYVMAPDNTMAPTNNMAPSNSMAPSNNMAPSNTMAQGNNLAPNNNLASNNYMTPNNAMYQSPTWWQPAKVSILQKITDCFKTFYDILNTPRI